MTGRLAHLLAAAVVMAVVAQVLLQSVFATVRHPVALGVANTTGDAELVRSWHRRLLAQGTLEEMVATELVDLLWIAALAAVAVLATALAARLLAPHDPWGASVLRRSAPWTALAPGLDLLENALSLAMLADPLGFPAWLAAAHASVSRAKLAAVVAVAVGVPAFALARRVLVARPRGEPRARRGDRGGAGWSPCPSGPATTTVRCARP
ncbi:hypothetical protein ACU61A_25425 [Pseudonocardia sichuanensis]